jgi:hypothetical protein
MTYLKDGQESTQNLLKQLLSRLSALQVPTTTDEDEDGHRECGSPIPYVRGSPATTPHQEQWISITLVALPLLSLLVTEVPTMAMDQSGTHFSIAAPHAGVSPWKLGMASATIAGTLHGSTIVDKEMRFYTESGDPDSGGAESPTSEDFLRIYAREYQDFKRL